MSTPNKLYLVNQFGEESVNNVEGSVLPVPGAGNVCWFSGATAPVDGTDGDNFAGKGSLYTAIDTGALYQQTGLITNPVWKLVTVAS